jgi:hypothetical protein
MSNQEPSQTQIENVSPNPKTPKPQNPMKGLLFYN